MQAPTLCHIHADRTSHNASNHRMKIVVAPRRFPGVLLPGKELHIADTSVGASVGRVFDVVKIECKRTPLAAEVEAEASLDPRKILAVEGDAVARPFLPELHIL